MGLPDSYRPIKYQVLGLSAKDLAVAVIAVKEGYRQIFLSAGLPGLIKICFAKINLRRPQAPGLPFLPVASGIFKWRWTTL